jgi:hypothetical protein
LSRLGQVLCTSALLALVSAIYPVWASATIVVGGGIAGVRLGETRAQVRRHLGRPSYVRPPSWGYAGQLDGEVAFDAHSRVDDVWTVSTHQRTNRGIGPGSSPAAFRHAYPRTACYTHGVRGWTMVCSIQSRTGSSLTETDYLFRGQLRKVDVYVVPQPGPREPA